MSTGEQQSFFQHLWDQKLPQYLGTYLAVGFGVLQFLILVTNRYELPSSLVEKYLLVWLLLLPAVATLIYFKGHLQPTNEAGVIKWPKMLVIGNVVLAFILGGVLFNGSAKAGEKDSETITLTNEEGKEITHVVPSLNKVQSVASFRFENLTGDEEQDWWGMAFSNLLEADLEQRPEFYVNSEFRLYTHYDGLGLEGFKLPTVGMQREIAQKARNDYFTRISYKIENGEFVMKGNLYSSRDGTSVMELNAVDSDPYNAIHKLKQQISENIPGALETLENQISLPTASLLTNNVEALKYYTESQIMYTKDANALEETLRLGKKAVEADPTCAMCHLNVGGVLFGLGQRDETLRYVKNSIKYGASLPERMQFMSKEILYSVTQNADAYWKLLEVKRKMYPYSFSSYEALLLKYRMDYGIDSAKVLMNEAIDNGNIERGLLSLYDLQLGNEEYVAAQATLDRFSEAFPDREQDKIKYADIYEKQGKIKEAKDILIEAETMDPLNTDIQTRLAYVDFKNLDVDAANKRVDQGIAQATSLTDSLSFLRLKAYFLRMRGQIDESSKVLDDYESHSAKRINNVQLLATLIFPKSLMYQSVGQTEDVKSLITEIEKYLPEKVSQYECSFNCQSLINGFDQFLDSDRFKDCHEVYAQLGDGFGEYLDVLIAYEKGDYDTCLKILEADEERIMKMFGEKYFLAKIYLQAGQNDKAKELLAKSLDQKPEDPSYYYQMAEILESDDKSKAKENLDIALQYWENADAEFIPAQRARKLAARLN